MRFWWAGWCGFLLQGVATTRCWVEAMICSVVVSGSDILNGGSGSDIWHFKTGEAAATRFWTISG